MGIFPGLILKPTSLIPTDGLVCYYPFSGNANDASGNGNDGTVDGATLSTGRKGGANEAFSFDGNNDFIDATTFGTLADSLRQSFSIWFNSTDATQSYMMGVRENTGNDARTETRINTDSLGALKSGAFQCRLRDELSQQLFANDAGSSVMDGNWHHLVTLLDLSGDGNSAIYLDGISQTINFADNQQDASFAYVFPLYLGGFNNVGSLLAPYTGSLDDFRLYNRLLTADEITILFNE